MWVCLYDCFLSIVKKDCAHDELLVRARRKGDIEKIWKTANVTEYDRSDYQFRAVIKTADVIAALSIELEDINYGNFKDMVRDRLLHNAYLDMWVTMSRLQPKPPYSGLSKLGRRSGHKKK